MQTLLAHEWLAPAGGSENVFEHLMRVFPHSRKVCLWNDAPERFSSEIEETWLAKTPLRRSKAFSLPFFANAWSTVSLDDVDRVVVSSHAFAHRLAARGANRGIKSFCYVHSPARYIWAPEFDDRGQGRLARLGQSVYKRTDRQATSAEVSYAANSEFVRTRIRASWGQDSEVIYPPVEVAKIQTKADWRECVSDEDELKRLEDLPHEFVLGASRLVEYKRLDTAIAVGDLLDLPVVIVGAGPDEARLRELARAASVPVFFFGFASTAALYALYQAASLLVFMAIEDFGIMPVEAMALGTPVLVNEVGGARESVDVVRGGEVSPDGDISILASQARKAMSTDMRAVVSEVQLFSSESFESNVLRWTGGSL